MICQLVLLLVLALQLVATHPHGHQDGGDRKQVPDGIKPDSQEMINFINSIQTTWKAGQNFKGGLTLGAMAGMGGVLDDGEHKKLPYKEVKVMENLPKNFDARERWPNCPSIQEIRDQGNCGSCWATSVVEVVSDRMCIASGGKITADVSTEDLLGCCRDECGHGCNGGRPPAAWEYWVREGLVTGGLFNGTGCEPYTISPCEHHVEGPRRTCGAPLDPTPDCKRSCVASYGKSYDDDKIRGKRAYALRTSEEIMTDIYEHGPVQADFSMMSDFASYKSGVYQSHSTKRVTGHAIKIIGWGEEDSETPYWLVANSWNTDWGDKGFFKIRRGNNECGIEDGVHAGEVIV